MESWVIDDAKLGERHWQQRPLSVIRPQQHHRTREMSSSNVDRFGMVRPLVGVHPASASFVVVADQHLTSGLNSVTIYVCQPLIDGSTPHAAPLPGLESSSMGN
jgi:hypothetical protein